MDETRERLAMARQIALGAGAILLDHRAHLADLAVHLKARRNPVTEADLAAEDFIKRELQRQFAGEHILTEEQGEVRGAHDSPMRWIVDPLDGTVNFAHGLGMFAIAIALEARGVLELGIIYAPALGEMFAAARGAGATLNDKPIAVSAQHDLSEGLLATGFAYARNEVRDNNVQHFNDFILRVRDLRRIGSAAYDLACVACGRMDGYWELHLSPWDMAAGALLVAEAGGRVTDFTGGGEFLARHEIVATNGLLHEPVRTILAGSLPS
ncbi:MAG: inositol monophosphatase family protein [Planctomycetota bacterium]